ncbi:uncharacterized protein MEPE_01000 [Melanopsichium pennsylvanicum]|uniref:Uncharacterized protein n=2 Tax=Melanopsichium pennsylvanicum TaxID=63383 RepID=A0AAJ4XH44_9BASI|nr:conserved hypothetical protein [Melanopsichium pennsylvanicum 4]SNX82294.1 uncharacterized protein MEPE_01000 [Melanopsichium pennsylvanicum]
MPVKTRSKQSKSTASSSSHLHPSSAATADKPCTPGPSSASSFTTSNLNASTHVPLKPSANVRAPAHVDNGWTWNPIKLIERKLFRAYWNIEATFVLSMLEAWEVFLVIMVFITLTLLLWYSAYHYFPRHAREVATRALYYLYGNSPPPTLANAVINNATSTIAEQPTNSAPTDGVLAKLIETSNQLWASLDAEKVKQANGVRNEQLIDTLIGNLNKVKQMIADTARKAEL